GGGASKKKKLEYKLIQTHTSPPHRMGSPEHNKNNTNLTVRGMAAGRGPANVWIIKKKNILFIIYN
ncbi:hypothetical protein ACNIRS_25600, partial [Escherichia coli]